MPGLNSAQRLVDVLKKASGLDQAAPMSKGLSKLFEYEPTEPYREHAVRLEQLLAQVDSAEAGLVKLQFPEHLYTRQFTQVRSAFSPSGLNSNCSHITGHLSADVHLAFQWAAFAPPEDSVPIEPEVLAKMVTSLQAITDDPLFASLPQGLREPLVKYLTAMLDALRSYPITGVDPMAKAVSDFAIEIVVNKDAIDQATRQAGKDAEPLLKRAAAFAKQAVEVVTSTGKVAESVQKVWKLAADHGPQVVEWVKQLGS